MDHGFLNFEDEIQFGNQSSFSELTSGKVDNGPRFEVTYPDQKQVNGLVGHDVEMMHLPMDPSISNSNAFVDIGNCLEDNNDFSDAMLNYIDQMLMKEDIEERTLQKSLDLQAKERSFYEVLGQKYPPSTIPESPIVASPDDLLCSTTSSSDCSGYLIDIVDPSWINNRCSNISNSHSSSDSPDSPLQVRDIYNDNHSVWNFQKGVEDATKFLPHGNKLSINVDINGILAQELQKQHDNSPMKLENRNKAEFLPCDSSVKKYRNFEGRDLEEERSSKLPAIYTESELTKEFDDLLLHSIGEGEKKFSEFREDLRIEASKGVQQNGRIKKFNVGKGRGKKPIKKKEVIDLRTLLISCAQAIAADDRRSSNELLKQIRQHSSPFGDGNQRLAHYFADGLEARLAGTGSQIHKALVNKRTTTADYLKAYYTYIASSPFRKISSFASNRTIMIKSAKAKKIHVIDFGILYGFQWPTLIQRIIDREGGPPSIRITGIDFPQPGFRPGERIENTGRILAHYAKTFNVRFKYKAIAKNWDCIKPEDLKIEEDEYVVVTCLFRTRNLLDETVLAQSSRTVVLNLIRRINPALFIHGIVNGAYSAPFFVTRFREVLFHFSALFDMLENNVPREKPERLLIERDIFGREALNVIACEGWERVERPETYKQWQVRNMRAGFEQVPFEREVMNRSIQKVTSFYHKDFVIDEDGKWLLLGWKGRIIYAMSCWQPV